MKNEKGRLECGECVTDGFESVEDLKMHMSREHGPVAEISGGTIRMDTASPGVPVPSLPDNNPKTRAGGQNKAPLHLIPPAPKVYLAMAMADGGFKYGPYNYEIENISASVYYGAAQRHLDDWWAGSDRAKDSQVKHLAAAIACLWLVLDAELHGTLNDNRPPPVDLEALMDNESEMLQFLRERSSTKFELHDIPSPASDDAKLQNEIAPKRTQDDI